MRVPLSERLFSGFYGDVQSIDARADTIRHGQHSHVSTGFSVGMGRVGLGAGFPVTEVPVATEGIAVSITTACLFSPLQFSRFDGSAGTT